MMRDTQLADQMEGLGSVHNRIRDQALVERGKLSPVRTR
jgi:hypothetical protein